MVVVVFVRVGEDVTRVLVVVCTSPCVVLVVELLRVVEPEVRDVVVVVELAVRLVVVTVPRVFDEDVLERVAVELLRVAEELDDVDAALVDALVLLERVDAVRVLFMLRVPDNWLALAALLPLLIVEER